MLFIFDMGGVVTNTFQADGLYRQLGLTQDEFLAVCRNGKTDIWHELEIGSIGAAEFWAEFSRRAEGKTGAVRHDLFRLHFHPSENPGTVALIQRLKKKHRVVCGTNTIQSHWENHLERGDYAFFHQTYASNKIGVAKPDPLFFRLILQAEQAKAEDTFFTDDKQENCDAAAALGIRAVRFTTAAALAESWGEWT